MKRMEETRQALQNEIKRKERYIKVLIENIRDYGEKSVNMMDDDFNRALRKIETVGRWTREIEEEREGIKEIRQQIRLIDYLMKEGE